MKEYLILPLTKSPHQTGRIGPREKQDWHRGLVKAKDLQEKTGGKILVISNVHIAGERHEADLYDMALRELDVSDENIMIVRKAQETIEQIEIAQRISDDLEKDLIIISTFLHYLRVRWLCLGQKFDHCIAFGIPRPKEAVTDIILIFIFPFLDLVGLRNWFLEKITKRRVSGKH